MDSLEGRVDELQKLTNFTKHRKKIKFLTSLSKLIWVLAISFGFWKIWTTEGVGVFFRIGYSVGFFVLCNILHVVILRTIRRVYGV